MNFLLLCRMAYSHRAVRSFILVCSPNRNKLMTYVLLLDKKAPQKNDVQNWLNKNGLTAWLANDVPHAIEELSDFTVRNRPDVVLLEVAFLSESFDALRSTFNLSSGGENLEVLGLGRSGGRKYCAKDLDQLGSLLHCGTGVTSA